MSRSGVRISFPAPRQGERRPEAVSLEIAGLPSYTSPCRGGVLSKSALIVTVLAAGYLLTLPIAAWALADIGRIPGGVWRHAAERPRHQWRVGVIGAYVLGGWPSLIAVFVWWRSRERADLLLEWEDLSARKRLPHRHEVAFPDALGDIPSTPMGRADA